MSTNGHPLARGTFLENRHASDGDRVRIIMLDVPDRRPVEDVFCTDAHYLRLFRSAGLRALDVTEPLALGRNRRDGSVKRARPPGQSTSLAH